MLDNFGKDFSNLITMLVITLIIIVPLGIWKLLDIIFWLILHISIN